LVIFDCMRAFGAKVAAGKKTENKNPRCRRHSTSTHTSTQMTAQMMNGEFRSMPVGTARWVPSVVDISLVLLVHLVALHRQALMHSGEAIW
jgi:hypothetical protein